MSKRAGSLFVSLSADTSEFSKGLANAARDVAKLTRDIESVGRHAATMGAAVAAPIVLALKTAAEHSERVHDAVDEVKRGFGALADEVAQAALPAVKALSDTVAKVAGYIHSMSPEAKETAMHFAKWAVEAGGAGAAISAVAGGISSVSKLLSVKNAQGGSMFLGIAADVGVAVAALAALAVVAAVIREAWAENLGGIREIFASVWGWIVDKVGTIGDAFVTVFRFQVNVFTGAIRLMADAWARFMKFLGKDSPEDGGMLKDLAGWIDHITTAAGAAEAWNDFKTNAGKAYAFASAGAQKLKADIMSALGMTNIQARRNPKDVDVGTAGQIGSYGTVSDLGNGKNPVTDIIQGRQDQINKMNQKFGTEDAVNAALASPLQVLASSMLDEAKERFASVIALTKQNEGLEAAEKQTRAFAEGMAQAANAIIQNVIGKLGKTGEMMNHAMQGFQSGGVWGAVIAVIADLVAGSKQFQAVIKALDDTFQQISDAFGVLLESGESATKAIGDIVAGVFKAFGPVFKIISDSLADITPLFSFLKPLVSMLGMFFQIVAALLKPLQAFGNIVMRALFEVMKATSLVIMTVIDGIGHLWNAIVDAVAWIVGILDSGAAKKMQDAKFDTDALESQMRDLQNATYDNTKAQMDQAAAVQKATQAFLNVPQGYKVALATYQAIIADYGAGSSSAGTSGSSGTTYAAAHGAPGTTAGNNTQAQQNINHRPGAGMPHFAAGGVVTAPTVALIGEAGPEAVVPLGKGGGFGNVTINATIVSNDPKQIWRELKRLAETDKFRGSGS